MTVFNPSQIFLKDKYLFDKQDQNAKTDFWSLANANVYYRNNEERRNWDKFVGGDGCSNIAANLKYTIKNRDFYITGLSISVNMDMYSNENKDLIPYGIAHEVYELWSALRLADPEIRPDKIYHLLARRHEFYIAMLDGKAERLKTYLANLVKYSYRRDEQVMEFEYGYQWALKKTRGNSYEWVG